MRRGGLRNRKSRWPSREARSGHDPRGSIARPHPAASSMRSRGTLTQARRANCRSLMTGQETMPPAENAPASFGLLSDLFCLRGYTSSRPRKSERKNPILAGDDDVRSAGLELRSIGVTQCNQRRGTAQSSHFKPATRRNSLTLDVTSVAPRRRAWAASSTS